MKSFLKASALFTASLLAFSSVAKAQLQTYQTQTAYKGSAITFFGETLGETFFNVSAVKSMTYNFFKSTSGSSSATPISAIFGEWDASDPDAPAFVAGTTVSFGTIIIPASTSGWTTITNSFGTYSTYAYQFDLATINSTLINSTFGYLTNSTRTYALMLTDQSSGNTGLALGLTNTNAFAYGSAGLDFPTRDWTFAQIVVAPGNQQLVPVPESSTVAAVGSAVLVAGLVGFRLRQRRAAAQALASKAAA